MLFSRHLKEEAGPGLLQGKHGRRGTSVAALERDSSLRFEVRILNTFPPGELVLQSIINEQINYFNRY